MKPLLTEPEALKLFREAEEVLASLKNRHSPDVVERIRDIQSVLKTHANRLDVDVLRRGLDLLERNADELGGLTGRIGPAQRGLSAKIDHLRTELESLDGGLDA